MSESKERFRHSVIAPTESISNSVKLQRERFEKNVVEVKVLYRGAQRLESMWSSLTLKDGRHINAWEGPGNFKDMLHDLGVNVEQLDRIFGMFGDADITKPVYEVMAGFKEGGHQALADLLGKPVQYGWYDGFFENDIMGDPVNPQPAEKISPRYRIWKTEAEKEELKREEIKRQQEYPSESMLPGNSFN